jgi:hypothetical protein
MGLGSSGEEVCETASRLVCIQIPECEVDNTVLYRNEASHFQISEVRLHYFYGTLLKPAQPRFRARWVFFFSSVRTDELPRFGRRKTKQRVKMLDLRRCAVLIGLVLIFDSGDAFNMRRKADIGQDQFQPSAFTVFSISTPWLLIGL